MDTEKKKLSLKNYLTKFSKEQLIGQILELSKKYKEVKSYYDFCIHPNPSELAQKLKASIEQCFFPSRGFRLRLKDARKTVNEFKKLSPGDDHLLDVMLYYVECGVRFTNEYGDIDEPFYDSIGGMFKQAGIKYCESGKNNEIHDRARRIMIDSSGIGWGFHDYLADTYFRYFANNDETE